MKVSIARKEFSMEEEEKLEENTELIEYTDENIDDVIEMEGVEE